MALLTMTNTQALDSLAALKGLKLSPTNQTKNIQKYLYYKNRNIEKLERIEASLTKKTQEYSSFIQGNPDLMAELKTFEEQKAELVEKYALRDGDGNKVPDQRSDDSFLVGDQQGWLKDITELWNKVPNLRDENIRATKGLQDLMLEKIQISLFRLLISSNPEQNVVPDFIQDANFEKFYNTLIRSGIVFVDDELESDDSDVDETNVIRLDPAL